MKYKFRTQRNRFTENLLVFQVVEVSSSVVAFVRMVMSLNTHTTQSLLVRATALLSMTPVSYQAKTVAKVAAESVPCKTSAFAAFSTNVFGIFRKATFEKSSQFVIIKFFRSVWHQ